MKILEYNRDKARRAYDLWKKNHVLPSLSPDYDEMRSNLLQLFESARTQAGNSERKEYLTDILFGLGLYDYFLQQPWFNLRMAANDGFWRYLSVSVMPDIVAARWGNKDNYFWKQSNRLWPKTAWWFIHLAWRNSIDDTRAILMSRNFNSDTIQCIVERTGKNGTFVDVYREIIWQYSQLDYQLIVRFKKRMSNGSDSLFRAVMRLNTARCLVTDPCLCQGGVEGYVQSMIHELTLKL